MADLGQKISELAAATALDGTELIPVVQGGSTLKSTAAALETLVKDGLSKSDVGLGNVDNVRQYSESNPPPTPSAADVGAVPITRTVNGKALSSDVTLDASDVGAEGELTWDNSPTEGSDNPVKSGGIYDAILRLYPKDTVSGDPANFPDGADGIPVVDLRVSIQPVQEGSGDPSPSNVRPISGRTGMTLSHSGADTEDPETLSISWQTEAGTVYSGILDVTTGLLTVDRISKTFQSSDSWVTAGIVGNYNRYLCTVSPAMRQIPSGTSSADGLMCNILAPNTVDGNYHCRYLYDSRFDAILPSSVGINTTAKMATWAVTNGLQIVYPLETPITYQLTPTEVKTLLGDNNFWADCGPVEVEYRADPTEYVEKKIAELQALILENT